MLTSAGLALTPTFFCAMVGMLVLTALEQNPDLARNRKTRSILLFILGASFAILCLLLLRLRPMLPVMLILSLGALLFQIPAYLRLRYPDQYRKDDRSPWLWRWRSRIRWRGRASPRRRTWPPARRRRGQSGRTPVTCLAAFFLDRITRF